MWLIGMMGSGKTSVGRLVAEQLGVPFYDTDDEVVARAGSTIAALWENGGESRFRELERAAIHDAPAGIVAAAGGGAILDEVNRHVMAGSGPVVWLRAEIATLTARLAGASDRPLLGNPDERGHQLTRMLTEREEQYRAVATHIVDTDGRSCDDVAREVTELWSA